MVSTCRRFDRHLSIFVLVVLITVFNGFLAGTIAQQTKPVEPKVSEQALTDEQLSIYGLILSRWMGGEVEALNLADLTEVFPTEGAFGARDCFKGLDMEPDGPAMIHRFRVEDLAKLGNTKIRLVNSEEQEKEVRKHDPGDQIKRGKSIDNALKDGFANAKTWFSEIRFDKSHTHAVVFYGFRCGGLCGNGGTAIIEKKNGTWMFKSQCSVWMS